MIQRMLDEPEGFEPVPAAGEDELEADAAVARADEPESDEWDADKLDRSDASWQSALSERFADMSDEQIVALAQAEDKIALEFMLRADLAAP